MFRNHHRKLAAGRSFGLRAALAVGMLGWSLLTQTASAQSGAYPNHALRMIVPAAAAGPTDFLARTASDFLAKARERADNNECGNAFFVLGDEKSPKLDANSVDLALVLDAYHHFDYPESMLAGIRSALRAKGRLAIVDYYKRRGAMSNANPDFAISHVRLDDAAVVKEVEANGFKLISNKPFLPGSQYMAVFEKK